MPLPIIPVSPFPYIGRLPGVPQLARSLNFIVPPLLKIFPPAKPQALFHAVQGAPKWGVFNADLEQVIFPDSVRNFDYRSESRISNYPVQQGEFNSYNKVDVPFEASIHMVKGGTLEDRTTFLDDCQNVEESLDLFTIVSPERAYTNCNVTRLAMSRRETRGAFFVEVEMYFEQIQEISAQYSASETQASSTANAQQPPSRPLVNQGYVQPQNVGTQAQQSALQQVAVGGTTP